jgi:LDH2 family malate/lactate/ureidoglycolate dehydrogenase
MPHLPAADLRRLAADLLEGVGARPADAAYVADSLIEANLTGHDSHGVIRLLHYCEWCGLGSIDPTAQPKVVSRRGATAVVDGGWGWGMVAMRLAVETVIELATASGIGAVAVRRSNHIGRVAPYVARIADAGMVGLAVTNANAAVAPFGGRSRLFGTNPIAWGVPRGDGQPPLVHDIATAVVAEGKLRVARAKGRRSPRASSSTPPATRPSTPKTSTPAAPCSPSAATRAPGSASSSRSSAAASPPPTPKPSASTAAATARS